MKERSIKQSDQTGTAAAPARAVVQLNTEETIEKLGKLHSLLIEIKALQEELFEDGRLVFRAQKIIRQNI